MINPIQTRYSGVLYRSRTEARWARFLDLISVRFRYEAEGYDLGAPEGWYLPDFYLPDLNLFIEVKGTDPTEEEQLKCMSLALAQEAYVLLAVGAPKERRGIFFDICGVEYGEFGEGRSTHLNKCLGCQGFFVEGDWGRLSTGHRCPDARFWKCHRPYGAPPDELINRAMNNSASCRFTRAMAK